MATTSSSCYSRRAVVIVIVGLVVGSGLVGIVVKATAPDHRVPTSPAATGAGEPGAAARPAVVVQVLTTHERMPAESVEKTITKRIERWVNQAPGVERIESKSIVGASLVTVYFRDGVDPNTALTTTNSLALAALPMLPADTLPPLVLPCNESGPREIADILKLLADRGRAGKPRRD
jgi:hypothetical protein